jgi:hypothetical protein
MTVTVSRGWLRIATVLRTFAAYCDIRSGNGECDVNSNKTNYKTLEKNNQSRGLTRTRPLHERRGRLPCPSAFTPRPTLLLTLHRSISLHSCVPA